MAEVVLKNIVKHYQGNPEPTLKNINIRVEDKKFLVLLGPSGCGKSTILRSIAGLEKINSGSIMIGGKEVQNLPPRERDIAMVFQNYALFPHLNVYDNIAFGLKVRRVPKAEIEKKVRQAASILGLENVLNKRPNQLSGGQCQRVAVGRAIVRDPKVFLFDEPLSNLDAKLRVQMRIEINRLHKQLNATMIYVTHDQTEAMTLADSITVLYNGRVEQWDTPLNIYNDPENVFVAGFLGTPPMNLIKGKLERNTNQTNFVAEGLVIPLKSSKSYEMHIGKNVTVGIRPEDVYTREIFHDNLCQKEFVTVRVDVVEALGPEVCVYFKSGPHSIVGRMPSRLILHQGQEMKIAFDKEKIYVFDENEKRVRFHQS